MKNLLVFASSPRCNGNSDKLARAFCSGATISGNKVTTLFIRDMIIHSCMGCEYCYEHKGNCCQTDDMQIIYKQLEKTDIIVFATPIYYQAFPSQLKAVVDRLYVTENRSFPVKGAILLATYASSGKQMSELTITYFKKLIEYHKWKNYGIIVKDGLDSLNDIDNDSVLNKAYELGISMR